MELSQSINVSCKKPKVLHIKQLEGVESRVSDKEMFKATCSECGQECEVPFKPDPSRPVYCRECWAKKRPARPRRY